MIANIVLAPLDEYIRERPNVSYYARYVDDMLLVAEAPRRTPSSARRIARTFLPIERAIDGELLLDASKLGRQGSRLRLQASKLKGYILTGRRGRDFLDTIERDVRLIASERRAFLLPDGLGSESPLTALFVGSDSDAPVQVLREVDRLKIERYAASVAISKAAVGVELLDLPESAKWCRRQLAPLAGHMTSPDLWLEFLDLSLRALSVCIRAGDAETARAILRRHIVHFRRLGVGMSHAPVTWNGKKIRWAIVRRALLNWYENRRLEEIASSIPLTTIVAGSTGSFLRRVFGRDLRATDKALGSVAITNRAWILRTADLRTTDRETDLQQLHGQVLPDIEPRVGRLGRAIRQTSITSERWSKITQFLQACRDSNDHTYRNVSVPGVLLMTRPPTQFDVSCRWAKAKRSLAELSDVTNAMRGTRYVGTVVRQPDATTIDITSLDWYLRGRPEDAMVVLGNVQIENDWWQSAVQGNQVVTRRRMAGIGRIVNEAIRLKHRKKLATILVLPELSLPGRLLRPLAHRLIQEDVSLIAGLEYSRSGTNVVNEAVGVFAPGFKIAAVWWWPKSLPARGENRELLKLGVTFVEHHGTPTVVSTDFGAVSVLICSELLDVRTRGDLLGRIDLLVIPAWNQDTATFDHTIQTTANDLHCYAAVANNALFSDCRVQVPSEERFERDACRLISRGEDTVIAVVVSADTLRKFQLASLADPTLRLGGFKPLPPGYEFKRI